MVNQPQFDTTRLPDIDQRLEGVPHIGLVIGTCGTPSFIHLQLEMARRMFGGELPVLVVNDGDDAERHSCARLQELCDEYGAAFVFGSYIGHAVGDLRCFREGLRWAYDNNIQLLVKFSRRFVPLRPWRHDLLCVAAYNRHVAAFARLDERSNLWRTDAVALRVDRWMNDRVSSVLDEAISMPPHRVHVENMMHSLARACGGYVDWPFVPRDFYRPDPNGMQWRGVLPTHYADLARSMGLDYKAVDFAEGRLMEVPKTYDAHEEDLKAAVAAHPGPVVRMPDTVRLEAMKEQFDRRSQPPGDIHEHMPILRDLASECPVVTEMGTRSGNSSIAFLMGKPKVLTCYDIDHDPATVGMLMMLGGGDTEVRVIQADTADDRLDIQPCDLLFIDTYHTAKQLRTELCRHHSKASNLIVLHDTVSFGEKGEDGGPGLREVVDKFLLAHPEWGTRMDLKNCNGLMVLERKRA